MHISYGEMTATCFCLNFLLRENPILQGAANLGRGLVNFIFPFSNLKQEREDVSSSAVSDDVSMLDIISY